MPSAACLASLFTHHTKREFSDLVGSVPLGRLGTSRSLPEQGCKLGGIEYRVPWPMCFLGGLQIGLFNARSYGTIQTP